VPKHDFEQELERTVAARSTDVLACAPGATLARRFRHNAPIVTQMIAMKVDAPQTRLRRRAGQREAAAAYGATGATLVKGRRATGPSWPA
jgi:hypothetical protein